MHVAEGASDHAADVRVEIIVARSLRHERAVDRDLAHGADPRGLRSFGGREPALAAPDELHYAIDEAALGVVEACAGFEHWTHADVEADGAGIALPRVVPLLELDEKRARPVLQGEAQALL